jgi:hypothetical protein
MQQLADVLSRQHTGVLAKMSALTGMTVEDLATDVDAGRTRLRRVYLV